MPSAGGIVREGERIGGEFLWVRIAASVRDASVSDVFGTQARIGTENADTAPVSIRALALLTSRCAGPWRGATGQHAQWVAIIPEAARRGSGVRAVTHRTSPVPENEGHRPAVNVDVTASGR